ncbi:AAA family ATPase [Brachybacterium paraconglomeratum]|uniref:AAA family ATPase n=1 Tax=Brachybacterium paraconglomeratum TaxID=173362 RepID=UPI0022AFE47E|nr:AAA family ATPase [Brachybacterium paraconglomeratum]MCZ4327945.1 AAA family ATPase [Brachybacterium paraconglomeratum]
MTYEFSIGSAKDKGYRVIHEKCRIRTVEFGSEDAFFWIKDGEMKDTSMVAYPRVQDDRLALVAFSGIEDFRPLFDGLTGIEVFSPSPDSMRLPQTPDPGDTLHRDASNIASVIGRLEAESPATKDRIQDYLSAIVPGIHSVRREAAGAWETLSFQQDVKGARHAWQFPSTSVSDGTLRSLAILTAMLDTAGTSPSPIGIEEPETALHPAAAGVLLDSIRDAAESRQIIVTSHSPDLLDSESIEPDELLAVRSVQGTTLVNRPDAAAQVALRENLFTAGDLLRTDQLQPETGSSELSVGGVEAA